MVTLIHFSAISIVLRAQWQHPQKPYPAGYRGSSCRPDSLTRRFQSTSGERQPPGSRQGVTGFTTYSTLARPAQDGHSYPRMQHNSADVLNPITRTPCYFVLCHPSAPFLQTIRPGSASTCGDTPERKEICSSVLSCMSATARLSVAVPSIVCSCAMLHR
jgi:hypothetical protein